MPCMAGPSDDEDKSPARDIIASSAYSCCYGDASSNANQNIPDHLHGFGPPGAEIYTMISSGVENMIGFSPKNPQSGDDSNGAVPWKGSFFARGGPQHDLTELLKQSPLQPCVFPCEGNERRPSSHGLSLSLNPFNPSSIGVQSSFELRLQQQQQQQEEENELFRFGPSSSRFVSGHHIQQPSLIRNSRFLGPAQELLREFCDLGWKHDGGQKMKAVEKDDGIGDELGESENPVKRQPLYSLDLLELQRRKSKLLHMLEEVERRYRNYREEMRAVTSSFEWVCGSGAATSYSILASKAMSRHFRCLKDGILNQIKATKAAMGEDSAAAAAAAAGTAKGGETPRLRILDQTMRQQRAIQQMSNMEIHPWRPQRGLPERSVSVLRAWLFEHFLHPYPSDVDKHILARQTGLSRSQVSNWFINARVRLWKPMVEEMYLEELKEDHHHHHGDANGGAPPDRNPPSFEEQKPDTGRVDPDSLSSIIDRRSKQPVQAQEFGRVGPSGDSFGFGFLPYGEASCQQDGVSLTLGLHQHGTGVGMPAGSLFYSREAGMEEECQTVQYSSLLEGESQNPPYRNLMGAQLLHDLAGAG